MSIDFGGGLSSVGRTPEFQSSGASKASKAESVKAFRQKAFQHANPLITSTTPPAAEVAFRKQLQEAANPDSALSKELDQAKTDARATFKGKMSEKLGKLSNNIHAWGVKKSAKEINHNMRMAVCLGAAAILLAAMGPIGWILGAFAMGYLILAATEQWAKGDQKLLAGLATEEMARSASKIKNHNALNGFKHVNDQVNDIVKKKFEGEPGDPRLKGIKGKLAERDLCVSDVLSFYGGHSDTKGRLESSGIYDEVKALRDYYASLFDKKALREEKVETNAKSVFESKKDAIASHIRSQIIHVQGQVDGLERKPTRTDQEEEELQLAIAARQDLKTIEEEFNQATSLTKEEERSKAGWVNRLQALEVVEEKIKVASGGDRLYGAEKKVLESLQKDLDSSIQERDHLPAIIAGLDKVIETIQAEKERFWGNYFQNPAKYNYSRAREDVLNLGLKKDQETIDSLLSIHASISGEMKEEKEALDKKEKELKRVGGGKPNYRLHLFSTKEEEKKMLDLTLEEAVRPITTKLPEWKEKLQKLKAAFGDGSQFHSPAAKAAMEDLIGGIESSIKSTEERTKKGGTFDSLREKYQDAIRSSKVERQLKPSIKILDKEQKAKSEISDILSQAMVATASELKKKAVDQIFLMRREVVGFCEEWQRQWAEKKILLEAGLKEAESEIEKMQGVEKRGAKAKVLGLRQEIDRLEAYYAPPGNGTNGGGYAQAVEKACQQIEALQASSSPTQASGGGASPASSPAP